MRRWLAGLALIVLATVSVRSEDPRIASFSPGATQIILDLKSEAQIVAATRWCPLPTNHPATRNCDAFVPDLEALIQVKPSLVVLPRLANPLWAERCQQAGLHTCLLNSENANSVTQDILTIGEAIGKKSAAEKIVAQFQKPSTQKTFKLMVIWDGMIAGTDSYLAQPLEHFGFQIIGTKTPWKKTDHELMLTLKPEVMLWITSDGQDSTITPYLDKQKELLKIPGLGTLPCIKNGKIFQTTSGHRWLPGSGLLQLEADFSSLRQVLE